MHDQSAAAERRVHGTSLIRGLAVCAVWPASIVAYGGRYLVRGGAVGPLEGAVVGGHAG